MKAILLLITLLLFVCAPYAQCTTTVQIQPLDPELCEATPSFHAVVTTDCSEPYTVHYRWTLTRPENTPLSLENTVPSVEAIPHYPFTPNAVGNFQACLCVEILSMNNDNLSMASDCSAETPLTPPLSCFIFPANPVCGESRCVHFQVHGGIEPYTYTTGEISFSTNYYCIDSTGTFQVNVTDARGCVTSSSINITNDNPMFNAVCETATAIADQELITDTICAMNFFNVSCSDISYSTSSWYKIETGENTILQIGLGYAIPNNMGLTTIGYAAIELYQQTNEDNCENMVLTSCISGYGCTELSTPLSVTTNSTYFIRVVTGGNIPTWRIIKLVAVLSNEPSTGICGCTQINSCNYSPLAIINDGSCTVGCTDPTACNYSAQANCNDGSCIYANNFTAQIFNDINGDGIRNNFPAFEPLLGGIGSIYISEVDMIVVPNNQGNFEIPSLPPGAYTINFTDPNGYWVMSSNAPLNFTLPTCNGLEIPVRPLTGAAANVYPSSALIWSAFHCSNGFSPGASIQNIGTTPLNAVLTIQFDPSLTIGPFDAGVNATVNNGMATFTLSNLAPGAVASLQLDVQGPGANLVGQTFQFTGQLMVSDIDANLIYENTWNRAAIVTCAYDPNDKSAVPEGYGEARFILADTEIEYRIRFQNTGNAYATNVVIEDQIDNEHLDLTTLELLGASHSYSTIIESNGRVRFVFANIHLPDSVHDEPNSHGFVAYKIRPRANIAPSSVITNTAAIYFDENPPIITNTTTHTIFDCEWWNDLAPELEQCAQTTFSFTENSKHVETYDWTVDGLPHQNADPSTGANTFILPIEVPGDHEITLTRTNPLCTSTQSFLLHVRPTPTVTITESNGVLFASAEGDHFRWFLNGQIIMGAIENSYTPTASGNYSVNVTNEWSCSGDSDPYNFTYIGVQEADRSTVVMYPNPAQTQVQVLLPPGLYMAKAFDAQGRLVKQWNNVSGTATFDVSAFEAGLYHFRFKDGQGKEIHSTLVK